MKLQTPSIYVCVMIITLAGCQGKDKPGNSGISDTRAFIHPPIQGIDVPYKTFSFVAEHGDTIFHDSGSILVFPGNSIVDKDGKPVKGKVDILYREFSDPVDFFIAGIPMDYKENGNAYVFESSAMCEVKGMKDEIPVFINQQNKPRIYLAGNNSDTAHNLYVLDTVQRQWVKKGKDEIIDISRLPSRHQRIVQAGAAAETPARFQAPMQPWKASGNMPRISIEVEPGSVPELFVYDNLQFEIDKSDKNWSPKYSDILWSDVKLVKSPDSGVFVAKFSNATQAVYFRVRPVLEGKDYDDAMKVFEGRKREYEKLKIVRMKEQQLAKKEMEKQLEEN